jgi:hypothetical protein
MPTMGEQLVAKLTADSAVTALVSSRIFPNVLPQGSSLPAIVYTVVDDVPQRTLSGAVDELLHNSRVQIDCYARASASLGGYAGAHQLADAVNNVVGNLSDPTLNSTAADKRDLYDNETSYFRVSMDFSVWH